MYVGCLRFETNISSLMYMELFIAKTATARHSTYKLKLTFNFCGFPYVDTLFSNIVFKQSRNSL
jgi:hypothetical protein